MFPMPPGSLAPISHDSRTDRRRCPACGQKLDPAAPDECPLCHYRFDRGSSTSDDGTPYAAAYADGRPGWWEMVRWVYAAREIRLKHLALMRVSAAARHFARTGVLWGSIGVACFEWTRQGWRWAEQPAGASLRDRAFRPVGDGWFHIASSPRVETAPAAGPTTELWWNAAEALLAAPLAVVMGIASGLILLTMIRGLVARAHGPTLRADRRMGAALCYSVAWIVPLVAAAGVIALRPLAYAGGVAQWFWYPPQPVIDGMAGVTAIGGIVLWWFWLFRTAMTAPAAPRAGVVLATAGIAPLLVGAGGTLWYFGFPRVCEAVFRAMGLQA